MGEMVAIVGASDKADRYSYKAFKMLKEFGHTPVPIHPRLAEIEGDRCYSSLSALKDSGAKIDTVTMYVRADLSTPLADDILALTPKRVIFNPGTENPELATKLRAGGINTVEACTLVLLKTGQFT